MWFATTEVVGAGAGDIFILSPIHLAFKKYAIDPIFPHKTGSWELEREKEHCKRRGIKNHWHKVNVTLHSEILTRIEIFWKKSFVMQLRLVKLSFWADVGAENFDSIKCTGI